MEAILLLLIVVAGFYGLKWLLKAPQPVELKAEELTVYVGRATH